MYYLIQYHGSEDGGELQRFETLQEARHWVNTLQPHDLDEGDIVEIIRVDDDGNEQSIQEKDMANA